MKIDRLIGIITVLLQNDRTTAPELARRFEVSRRTINRDIEDICRAGIPVVSTQGCGGGLSIAEGYKLDKTVLTQEELQDVLAGLRGVDSVSKRSTLPALSDKLAAGGRAAEDVVIIDLASHYQDSLTQKIALIKTAIRERRVLSFRYYYEKGEAGRTIEPCRLIFRWSSWYVFGFCLDRQDYRLFKLNRLWDPQALEERFTPRDIPPEKLEFGQFLSEGRIRLRAVFESSEKYRLIEEYGPDSYFERADKRLSFERDFASYENMREWIFSFGDRVNVLAPEKLREDRRRQAENILRQKNFE